MMDTNSPLIGAFPASLTPDAERLSAVLDPQSGRDNSEPFRVTCDGEVLRIPYRIYRPVISWEEFAALDSTGQAIAACWFTRHHDGSVREGFLRAMPSFDSPWVISYGVALCGEYVVELLDYIWGHRVLFDTAVLGRLLRDNPEFWARTRSRVVSYWDCYHRDVRFEDYVGSRLIGFFDECIAAVR